MSSSCFDSTLTGHRRLPRFETFEQCNKYLLSLEEADIYQYLKVAHNVIFDHDVVNHIEQINMQSYWVEIILRFLIDTAHHGPSYFQIELQSLQELGFNVLGQKSRTPAWFRRLSNRTDDNIKMERRFLKRHKLIEHIDYVEVVGDLDGETVSIGHNINRVTFYRLMTKEYGARFLESVLSRLAQVCYYFNEYKKAYQNESMQSMQRTINGLNEDVKRLAEAVNRDDYRRTEFDMISRFEDSYTYPHPLTPVSSEAIMSNREYPDELAAIHDTIETSINQVDGKITDINAKLIDITSKIDELVETIALTSDSGRNTICSRCSTNAIEQTRESNPIIDHVNSIFQQYEQINGHGRRFRNTCIGYEQHL